MPKSRKFALSPQDENTGNLLSYLSDLEKDVNGKKYGLRRGEVVGLKWDAIDFERGTITIKHTVTSVQMDGKIVWLETGNEKSGLQHIINEHGRQFNRKGILNSDIPNYVLEAVYQGNIVGIQGKRSPRTIYEFIYNGQRQRIAVQVSTNGYIVSANLKSIEE